MSLFVFLTIISCQKDEKQDNLSRIDAVRSLENIDITSVENSTSAEISAIYEKYENDHHLDLTEYEIIESNTIHYSGITGKSVVMDYEAGGESGKTFDNSLIFLLSSENEVETFLKYALYWEEGIGYVTISTDHEENLIYAEINSEYEVLSLGINKIHGDGSYTDCLTIAVSSCVEDGTCGFICGIIWRRCLGAIGLACLGHHI